MQETERTPKEEVGAAIELENLTNPQVGALRVN